MWLVLANLFILGSPILLRHNVGLVNEDVVISVFGSVLLMLSRRVQITVITVSLVQKIYAVTTLI